MKKLSGMITLILCLFLVTSMVSAVSFTPTNVIEYTANTETKTTAETPDLGGVIGIPNTGESSALVAHSSNSRARHGRGVAVNHTGHRRWVDHPAFIGIA